MKKRLKNNFLNIVILLSFCLTALFCFAEEQITITTYYPAPVGVYRELRSMYMAIGSTFANNTAYCWAPAGMTPCLHPIDFLTSLAVEGRVGIGVANATTTMDIMYVPPAAAGAAGGNEPIVTNWTVGMNWSSHASQPDPQNFSIRYAPSGGLMGFTAGDGSDNLPRGWYVVDTSSGTPQTEFSVRFDDDLIFLNRARVGVSGGTAPALNVTGMTLMNGSLFIPTSVSTQPYFGEDDLATVRSSLDVRGYSNTCVVVAYGPNSGDTTCPDTYYTTIQKTITPPLDGPMHYICCKVCENDDLNRTTGACL